MDELLPIISRLSDKRVLVRKAAIRELRRYLQIGGGKVHLARLSLEYLSSYDPAWTIRNLAKQALENNSTTSSSAWENTHLFVLE